MFILNDSIHASQLSPTFKQPNGPPILPLEQEALSIASAEVQTEEIKSFRINNLKRIECPDQLNEVMSAN